MISKRTRQHRARLLVASKPPAPQWQEVWAEAARRYHDGELSDRELDVILAELPELLR